MALAGADWPSNIHPAIPLSVFVSRAGATRPLLAPRVALSGRPHRPPLSTISLFTSTRKTHAKKIPNNRTAVSSATFSDPDCFPPPQKRARVRWLDAETNAAPDGPPTAYRGASSPPVRDQPRQRRRLDRHDSGKARRLCANVQTKIVLIPCEASNAGVGNIPWGILLHASLHYNHYTLSASLCGRYNQRVCGMQKNEAVR